MLIYFMFSFQDIHDEDLSPNERSNYIIRSDGDKEYLMRLDEMNEGELETLLEELKHNPAAKSQYFYSNEQPPSYLHQHCCKFDNCSHWLKCHLL